MSSTTAPEGPRTTDLGERLAVESRRAQDQRFDELERSTTRRSPDGRRLSGLAWLALLPEWTDVLAVEHGLVARDDADELLRRLKWSGLIEQRTGLTPDGVRCRVFWIRSGVRPDVGRYLRRTLGATEVDKQLRWLADALNARSDGEQLGLRPWLDLCGHYLREGRAFDLAQRVQDLAGRGEIPAAVRLVGAADVVGDVVGPPLSDAVRRAQWRIERAHRVERDRDLLRYYVHRNELDEALRTLVSGSDGRWALHLKGGAGVGKTMVIRFIAYSWPRQGTGRDESFPVARVDFDHLDPRYPEQRPGELVLALMAELLGYAGEAGDEAHRRLQETVDLLHEERARSVTDPAEITRLDDEMVDRFAAFLATLPGPQMLILDTCEELAKLYAPGAPAPAIDRTFGLLERVHERCPSVRVVLAGRRWLVPPPPDDPRTAAEPRLFPRAYLRVVALRDFDEATARRYLALRESAAGRRDPRLWQAILDVVRARGQDGYNPFELNAYCEWAASDGDLTPETLGGGGGDPYIERRLLGRIDSGAVRAALPVALAFGRFDLDLLAPALHRLSVDPREAFDGLAAQEWVNVLSVGPTGLPHVIEIDGHLLDRMRRVVHAERPVDSERLGADAAAVVDDASSLGELPRETVESAVRLLPVRAAADLWARIDARLLDERQWGWAYDVAVHTAAAEEPRAARSGDSPTILAAIHATQAVARRHTGHPDELTPLWRQVDRYVDRYPDPPRRAALRHRARLGLIAAGDAPPDGAEQSLDGAPPDALVAAAEAIVGRDGVGYPPFDHLLARVREQYAGTPLGAAAALVRAIAALQLTTAGPISAELAATAEELSRRLAVDRGPALPDWSPPRGLVDRCRLVWLLARAPTSGVGPAVRDQWWAAAIERSVDLDAERLLSALLMLDAEDEARTATRHAQALATVGYVPGRAATQWLHRRVPPLVVALAETQDIARAPAAVLAALNRHESAATYAADDPDTIDACQLARLRLARRYRDLSYAGDARDLARRGAPLVRAEAWLVLTLIEAREPADPAEAGSYYGWWRCRTEDGPAAPPPDSEPGIPAIASAATWAEFSGPDRSPEHAVVLTNGLDVLWPHLVAELVRGAVATIGNPELLGSSLTPAVSAGLVEVGEVLALRDPEQGFSTLRAGAGSLASAGRRVAALRASILAGLAARRAGNRSGYDEAVAEVLRIAEEIRLAEDDRRHDDEPPTDPAEVDPPPDPVKLVDDALAGFPGWALRWAALRDPSGYAPVGATKFMTVQSPEFGLHRPSTPAPMRFGVPERALNVLHSFDGSLGRILNGITFVISAVLLFYSIPGMPVDGAVPSPTPPVPFAVLPRWAQPVLFAVLILSTAAILYPTIRAETTGFPRALRVVPSSDGAHLVTELRAWRLDRRTPRSLRVARYRAAGPRGRRLLRGTLRARGRRPAILSLSLNRADDPGLDWERNLSHGAAAHRVPALLWYRHTPGAIPSVTGLWTRGAYGGPSRLAPAGTWTRASDVLPNHLYRLTHLIGTPIVTTAGLQLRLRDDLSTESSRRTQAGELLVSVAPIARQSVVVVLQAEPADEPQNLGEQRGAFIRSAGSAIDAGAGAVLVIPPLPESLGAALVEFVWRRFDRGVDVTPLELLRLLHQLKLAIAALYPPPTAEPERSVVLDLLLFMRTN